MSSARELLYILFGASLTIATALSLGILLFRLLKIRLPRTEALSLAFPLGAASLSTILFLLCATHLARKGVYIALAAVSVASVLLWRRQTEEPQPPSDLPKLWRWSFPIIFAAFTLVYFIWALAPEISPDGNAYHLAVVDHYNRAHGFERVPTDIYFNISQGVELLFLMAYAFGKHSSAALVHLAFLATLPGLVLGYARRFGFPLAGVAAAVMVYAAPVAGIDGSSAYNDVALATVLFATFYLLQIWDQQRDNRLLILVGILAGFAIAVKYTGFLAPIYALGFVGWKLRRLRPLLTITAMLALTAAPWLVKNWIWVQNPVAPFANRIFPNRWVHVSFEHDYQTGLRHYELKDRRQIPLEVTYRGTTLGGLLGPIFLLAPLALLGLRFQQGRRLLLASVIFALPYLDNIGTRFLIPPLPFLSLALALALARWPGVLFSVMIAHAILSWPSIVGIYCAPSAWHIDGIPVEAALRIESEDSYLRRLSPGYTTDRLIEDQVPKGESVFLFGATSEAYTTRRMLVRYLSAPNEVLGDILWTPIFAGFQPTVVLDFPFPARPLKKIRAVQTYAAGAEMWSISEFRIFAGHREIPRSPQWRLSARPNPWDVQLAFDNSPVTRWRTWETAVAGNYVAIDFGSDQTVDDVKIESSPEYTNSQIRLETLDANGSWIPLGVGPRQTNQTMRVDLRRAAAFELKARGVRYIVVNKEDANAEDLRLRPSAWGLALIGEAGYDQLYHLE